MPAFYGSRKYDALGLLTPQTRAFVAASQAAGTTIPRAQANILDRYLTRPVLNNGLWPLMTALYPFIGGTAASHSINLITPGTYSITWSGTVTHDANGITGDGTTGYGSTGLTPGLFTPSSGHIAVYNRTAAPSATIRAFTGSYRNAPLRHFALFTNTSSNGIIATLNSTGVATHVTVSDTRGLLVGSRTATGINDTQARIYRNGVGAGTLGSSTADATGISSDVIPILAERYNGNVTIFIATNLALASYGAGLTTTQIDALGAIVESYQSALGRKV